MRRLAWVAKEDDRYYLSPQMFYAALPVPTLLQLAYIRRLAEGQWVTEIAKTRCVSPHAVYDQMATMLRRYRARSTAQLVATAIRAGWLPALQEPAETMLPRPPKRRLDVIRLIAAGYSEEEAAARLRLLRSTVKTHLDICYRQYGVRRQSQLVALALKQGWIK